MKKKSEYWNVKIDDYDIVAIVIVITSVISAIVFGLLDITVEELVFWQKLGVGIAIGFMAVLWVKYREKRVKNDDLKDKK